MQKDYQALIVTVFLLGFFVYMNSISKLRIIEAIKELLDDENSTIKNVERLNLTELLRYSSLGEVFSFVFFNSFSFLYETNGCIFRKAEISDHLGNTILVYFRIIIRMKTIKEVEIIESYDF